MPDEPQELASVEDITGPAFGVPVLVEEEEELTVEIGTFGGPFVGLGATVEPGNFGDNTRGGLKVKGWQVLIQSENFGNSEHFHRKSSEETAIG
jgi:hypothetical protein